MRKIAVFASIISLLLLGFGCGNVQTENPALGKALDFELNDINGGKVKLSDYSGRVIILNFFATWCPPCRMEMPDFDEIQDEYKDKVKIIAVNVGRENVSEISDFAAKNNLKFSILMDDGKVSRQYGPIRAIPATFVIDKNFNIARKYVGQKSKDVFVSDIEQLSGKE